MMRTLLAMQDVDLGIRTERVLTMRVPLAEHALSGPPSARIAFFAELLRRVGERAGRRRPSASTPAASLRQLEPAGAGRRQRPVRHAARPRPPGQRRLPARHGDLAAQGPAVRGRRSGQPAQHLALVNEAFVRRYSDGRDAAGTVDQDPTTAQRSVRAARRLLPGRRRRPRHGQPQLRRGGLARGVRPAHDHRNGRHPRHPDARGTGRPGRGRTQRTSTPWTRTSR